jgi:non-specific serine/threonine protein kinase
LIKAATGAMRHVALDSPRRAAKAHYEGLTARERMVAVHIAIGETNREIAEALILSERTIETHVANILSKLGFSSRAQIAAWAVKKGLSQGQ